MSLQSPTEQHAFALQQLYCHKTFTQKKVGRLECKNVSQGLPFHITMVKVAIKEKTMYSRYMCNSVQKNRPLQYSVLTITPAYDLPTTGQAYDIL